MRSPKTRNFIAVMALTLAFAMAGGSIFAQGKGHGGGGGKGNGGGQGQRGGPPPNAGRKGPPPQIQRAPQAQFQRPQPRPQPQFQRPQPQFQRPQPNAGWQKRIEQRPQPQVNPGWQMGRGQERARMRMEQRPQSQPQQWRIEKPRKEDRRPEFRSVPQYDPWQAANINRGGKKERERQNAAPGLLAAPVQSRAWPNNYGYDRSTEVHLRNAERKALKEQEKAFRQRENAVWAYNRNNYYYPPARVDVRRTDGWRDNVLRTVVANVLTANTTGSYYYLPQYTPAYSYTPSYDYYPQSYDYGNYYGSSYVPYQYYDPYQSGNTVTYYNFYDPYGYSYSGNSPYLDSYSYAPEYLGADIGLPVIGDTSSIGGFVSRLFSELLAFGYNQGYRDALYTRSQNQRVRYFNDPYDPYVYVPDNTVEVYEDVGYDPYSCLGENRRYLSEGYELGYRDALYGTTDYDPYYNDGNVDLISALIGSSLSL